MNEEKDLGVGAAEVAAPEVEAVQEVEKLSLRDALEVALKTHEDAPKDALKDEPKSEPKQAVKPIREVVPDLGKRGQKESRQAEGASKQAIEPPAEYSAAEKEDFKQLPIKAQEAAIRLHNSRKGAIEQIRREREIVEREKEQVKWARDVVSELEPFLKVNGRGEKPAHAEIIKALKLVNEYDKDPVTTAIAILNAKGIPVPADLAERGKANQPSEELRALQNEVNNLKLERQEEIRSKVVNVTTSEWNNFTAEKNAAGTARYPDINESESGLKLARAIGSLVIDDTPLARQFIENARARIPNLTYGRLLQEAYKYCGGTVDDSSAPAKTQSDKSHLIRSSRAASSVPGRGGATTANSGVVKKYKTTREAAAAALAEIRESEGH